VLEGGQASVLAAFKLLCTVAVAMFVLAVTA
jgi:hypothetical protein